MTGFAEIAAEVAPGKHAVLVVDQAGWHLSDKLIVPPNISPIPLPPYAPELNPVEGLWSSLKAVELANLTTPTLAEVIDQAHKGIERVRRTRT